MEWRIAAVAVLAVVALSCAGDPVGETSTTAVPVTSSTTPTPSTTTTVAETTTTTVAGLLPLQEFVQSSEWDRRVRLTKGATYVLEIEGVPVRLTPPTEGWELLGYQSSGEAQALFAWRGPSGFRPETLDVLIWGVTQDGEDAAWTEIEEEFPINFGSDDWEWTAEGFANVGGTESVWREVTSPINENFRQPGLGIVSNSSWIPGTTARFYLVPVGEFIVTVMGFESRCACDGGPPGSNPILPLDQLLDDTENELDMWLPELEAFLADLTFDAP